jgi:hypothetical protein
MLIRMLSTITFVADFASVSVSTFSAPVSRSVDQAM